ncbi:flavonoid-6-hydroxylase-like [Ziziphus jujuba]|uniref:Flavonoid-6-hydroxylase-like n=1 Tax=Ziziphus jujuba TaxID=326968 RepID=A0ABM4A8N4_ZIZJJ|nr:flavonoid-6-hydroxylase-like [Ziziphus jujuba]
MESASLIVLLSDVLSRIFLLCHYLGVAKSLFSRSARVWSNPNQFQPETFLTTCKDFDVRGQNFELIPFSSGRRVCPGISFALQVMQLTLANLLHAFEITTPSDEPVDLGETSGLTNMKATPLEVILIPRLSVDY